ncbi:MAG: winged helix-turn-helix domain-containing protein [Candidatus Nitrosopolaris sp.]
MLSVQELTNSGLVLKSEKIKRAVLTALADSEMVKILDAAMYQSKSVIQILRETGVSHSTAYRKIKWLVEERLLIIDKTEITQDGRKFSLFRTILKSFNVKYEYNKVVMEADQNPDTIRKIPENFFSLSEREAFNK